MKPRHMIANLPGPFSGMIPMISGRYYSSNYYQGGQATLGNINNSFLHAILFFAPRSSPASFDRIAIHLLTAYSGMRGRLGAYEYIEGQLQPGARIEDYGLIDLSTTGNKIIVISLPRRDFVWLAFTHNNPATIQVHSMGNTGAQAVFGMEESLLVATPMVKVRASFALGATGSENSLPSTFPTATITNNAAPLIYLRAE